MAFEGGQPLKIAGAVAGADLSAAANQYKFVKFNGTGQQVILCSALTDRPCGVLQAPAASSSVGEPVEVVALGQTKVKTDGSVAAGNLISTDASGYATPCVPGTDTTHYGVGQACETDGGAGSIIDAIVNCVAPARAA